MGIVTSRRFILRVSMPLLYRLNLSSRFNRVAEGLVDPFDLWPKYITGSTMGQNVWRQVMFLAEVTPDSQLLQGPLSPLQPLAQ
jgi:hypothetical protein